MKVKLVIEAVGDSREEALGYALQAITHAVTNPEAKGQRIQNALPSIHAPTAWVDYRLQSFRPRAGKPVACA